MLRPPLPSPTWFFQARTPALSSHRENEPRPGCAGEGLSGCRARDGLHASDLFMICSSPRVPTQQRVYSVVLKRGGPSP